MLILVENCWHRLKIARLIQARNAANLPVSAAFREVAAAERFRRGFEGLSYLLDSDPYVKFHITTLALQMKAIEISAN